jgi:hypothetical protein
MYTILLKMRNSMVNSLSSVKPFVSLIFAVGLEETTFHIMWDMSKSGSDAEECFLRQPQTQYYRDATADFHMFEKMPNVSRSPR